MKTTKAKWTGPAEKIIPKRRKKVTTVCLEIQQVARKRQIVIKSRIMQHNRLVALVAGTMGYSSSLKEKERRAIFGSAANVINGIANGEITDHVLVDVVKTTLIGIDAFLNMQRELESELLKLVDQLPDQITNWCDAPNQQGFGRLSLAALIGEIGDFSNYSNPGKVWKRMGCAPFCSDGTTHMGSIWRMGIDGKLSADEWTKFGYSPRRRSIAYVVGANLFRCNFDRNKNPLEYRRRADETKERYAGNHPEYKKPGPAHRHGMLMATKLLLKNLWIEWNR